MALATKGMQWMPWHEESMKDVANCDKPRHFRTESIGSKGTTQGSEPSQYLEEKKANAIS